MLVLVIKVAWQERWKAAASVISMGLVSGWGGQLRFSRRRRGSSGWSQKYGDSVPSVHAWGRYLVAGQREES
jgi:hypothetical protein